MSVLDKRRLYNEDMGVCFISQLNNSLDEMKHKNERRNMEELRRQNKK